MKNKRTFLQSIRMLRNHEILFCEIGPTCFKISEAKGILLRHLHNLTHPKNYGKDKDQTPLPNLVYQSQSGLIKKGKGIDPATQYNKATNIALACGKLNGTILHPGESFSFWKVVGPTTKKRGYKGGRVIEGDRLIVGLGGGLCNLGNTIHVLALHSPLTVTEIHYHSDALAPDHGPRVPMSSGTSVNYNYMDLQLRNDTDQDFQLLVWVADESLHAELRSARDIPISYEITEEGHHFQKEGAKYYRVSRIYRDSYDKATGKLLEHRLIRDNHSEVMFDPSQIPAEALQA